MTVFDYFDQIRVINLPDRTDRRREMDKELKILGLANDPRVSYFAAVKPNDMGKFTSIGARGVLRKPKADLARRCSRPSFCAHIRGRLRIR